MFSENGILKDGLSFDSFKQYILDLSEHRPEYFRKGQYIFYCCALKYTEYIKLLYNNAGYENIDCFYNDKNIDNFLEFLYDCIVQNN